MKKIIVSLSITSLLFSCNTNSNQKMEEKVTPSEPEIVQQPKTTISENVGEGLISKSDCLTCHKSDIKLVGPSFIEIAEKYEKSDGNIKMLADKIKLGGSGNWGQIAMQPHSNLTDEQINEMVNYILSYKNNE
jgi:cytochrome c